MTPSTPSASHSSPPYPPWPLTSPNPSAFPVISSSRGGMSPIPNSLSSNVWGMDNWSREARDAMRIQQGEERRLGLGVGRTPLGDVPYNQISSPALSSPFIASDQNAVWGAPRPTTTLGQRNLEEELAAAQAKIRELSLENKNLKEREMAMRSRSTPIAPAGNLSPPLSTTSSAFFDNMGSSMNQLGYGGYSSGSMVFADDEGTIAAFDGMTTRSGSEEGTDRVSFQPPHHLFISVLRGTFNFNDMRVEDIRPIVWIIANRQPKNNLESAALKAAVSNLANRFALPRNTAGATVLIRAIIEFAQALCFTSCGNYLCQQLLERGDVEDKQEFITEIRERLVEIASDKFGTHVLCKAVAIKELEEPISEALLQHGIFGSLKTGARRLWREYLERCRQAKTLDIFHRINEDMKGKWTDLACINEHGSIAVQQVFEVFGSAELTEPCFQEIISDISRVANNQFGHFVITKLLGYSNLTKPASEAILSAYPPVATTHHGVNFVKMALQESGRPGLSRYIEAICSHEEGRTPGIVAIATSSVGKSHLAIFVLNCLLPQEQARVRQVCRAYSTTLRNSQSGNDLLRTLGIIHAVGSRHRAGPA